MEYAGVVVFDSVAQWVVPMSKTGSPAIAERIRAIGSGGGTNMYPAMVLGYEGLKKMDASGKHVSVKHMIVLTDGLETCGGDPVAAASALTQQGVDVKVHVIGLAISAQDRAALETLGHLG